MNTAKQPSRPFAVLHHQPPFALKPLSWVLLTLCASHAFAADNLTLPSGERAGAEGVAVVSEQQTTEESNTAQASTAQAAAKLPSAVDGYTINKATLLAAEATDANLQGVSDAAKANVKPKTSDGAPIDIKLNSVKVRAKRFKDIGPMPGLALTKEQIPGNIQSISAKEIKEAHSLSLSDLLNSKLQSVNVNDYQGNPFQMDVTYRGFTASPQIGSPQGLSVFFDGIRVNEPFGDIVNWDMLPMNALGGFDLF
ncbi:MAG: Plug domain-containing protein, partial [Methylotenera sp.]